MEAVGDYEYQKSDLIGHGAFAVVYKGRKTKDPQSVVAIKSINKKNLSRTNLLGKEIRILTELTRLQHVNVVALYKCMETQTSVNLVMEYCNGGDLADYLGAKTTLSEDTIQLFLRQLAAAIKALKLQNIVHRDLKPQNILLCHSGPRYPAPSEITLKIADFGFARFLNDGVMAATLCGSPMYMAPEVIMSQGYNGKADLWSVGTIVFQCLTGKAPFQAQSPQQLKQYYEKNQVLTPKIPPSTSSELTDLLLRLLKRNAVDRMEFDDFFVHPFLGKAPKSTSPVPIPSSWPLAQKRSLARAARSPDENVFTTSPVSSEANSTNSRGGDQARYSSGTRELSSPSSIEERDGFVVVPANIGSDNSYDSGTGKATRKSFEMYGTPTGSSPRSSPASNVTARSSNPPFSVSPRPTYLPVSGTSGPNYSSDPIPVPTRESAQKQQRQNDSSSRDSFSPKQQRRDSSWTQSRASKTSTTNKETLMDCNNSSTENVFKMADISNMSPPTVKFAVSSPPLSSRRRFSGGGNVGTSPPSFWPQSPISAAAACWQNASASPLRRSGLPTPPMITNGNYFFGLPPIMGSPNDPTRAASPQSRFGIDFRSIGADMNAKDYSIPTGLGFGPYGITYPLTGGLPAIGAYGSSPPPPNCDATPLMYLQRGFSEGKLLEREHNETLAKLNFVLALVECIFQLAKQKSTPMAVMTQSTTLRARENNAMSNNSEQSFSTNENVRRAEQLVLYMKAATLLGSALTHAHQELLHKRLHGTTSVINALKAINERYQTSYEMADYLNKILLSSDLNLSDITANNLLYQHAMEICQSAAIDELMGAIENCFHKYHTAQIVFHGLAQQVSADEDKRILNRYKIAVEKRMYGLQKHGYLHAYDTQAST